MSNSIESALLGSKVCLSILSMGVLFAFGYSVLAIESVVAGKVCEFVFSFREHSMPRMIRSRTESRIIALRSCREKVNQSRHIG